RYSRSSSVLKSQKLHHHLGGFLPAASGAGEVSFAITAPPSLASVPSAWRSLSQRRLPVQRETRTSLLNARLTASPKHGILSHTVSTMAEILSILTMVQHDNEHPADGG